LFLVALSKLLLTVYEIIYNLKKNIIKKIYSEISSLNPFSTTASFALTYHSINNINHNLTSSIYQLQEGKFLKQIDYLNSKNINSCRDLKNLFNHNQHCILTFDDGYSELFEICLEKINHFNLHSYIFLCPKFIKANKREFLNSAQILQMIKSKKITFGSHTFSHVDLTKLNPKDLEFEIDYSKKWLEDKFSIAIEHFAYPFGKYNYRVVELVKLKKYNYAFTTNFGSIFENTDRFKIPRIDIWNTDSVKDFKLKINGTNINHSKIFT
jgi:peptidoglycan/xylan/chitin deacetylase (PgdA/CDA1 family)